MFNVQGHLEKFNSKLNIYEVTFFNMYKAVNACKFYLSQQDESMNLKQRNSLFKSVYISI
jgi:hypothetical protein